MIEFAFENISDCVFHHAARQPEAPALIQGHERVTYAALATLVGQAAVYLTGKGIGPGERIGIAMTNSIERVVLSLAALRIGAVTIELATDTAAPALSSLIGRFGMLATAVETAGPSSTARIPLEISLDWRRELASFKGDVRYAGDPESLYFLIMSSGSTGVPKGTVVSHRQRNVRSAAYANFAGFYSAESPGTLVLAAPASTSLTAQFLSTQLMLGGATVLLPVYRYLVEMVRELTQWDDAICPMPPVIARSFLTYAPKSGALFPKMRALAISGQPLPAQDKVEMVKRLTPNLYDVYGCAGFGLISCIGPAEIARESESVGKPIACPGIDIEIAGPDGVAVRPGIIGQLRLRGPNAATRFYHPEDNLSGTERLEAGWFYPGEAAVIDKSGYLILEGRIADAIKIGNATIYPPEIEDIILQHSQVAEAAVVGRPGPIGVEEIVAFVVGKPGFKKEDIEAHCRRKITAHKRPRYVYFLPQIPRTANGKFDRPALKSTPLQKITPL
jgi:long-chain acyl-CoA synthetase